MTTATPKRIAASIIAADLESVTGYWHERYPEIPESMHAEIQRHLDKFADPLETRCRNIAKGVRAWEVNA